MRMKTTKTMAALLVGGLVLGCAGDPPGSNLGETPAGAGPTVEFDLLGVPLPVIPLPNDVATRLDPDSPSGRYVNVSKMAPTFLESDTRTKANRLDGFGTFMPISVSFSEPLDLIAIAQAHAQNDDPTDDVVYLVDIDPASAEFGKRWPLDVGSGNFPIALEKRDNYFENDGYRQSSNIVVEIFDEDINGNGVLDPGEDRDWDDVLDRPNYIDPDAVPEDFLPEGVGLDDKLCEEEGFLGRELIGFDNLASFWEEETNTLIVRPVLPLRPLTKYAVILTTRLKSRATGLPVRSPWPFKHHATQAQALERLPEVLGGLGLSADEVAFAWTYTTGSTTRELEWVRAGLYGHGKMAYLAEEFPVSGVHLDLVTDLPESPYYGPISEFAIVLPILAQELGGGPKTRQALLDDIKGAGGVVLGTFDSPNFLVDRDGIATDDYPADDDEIFEIDPVTGESVRGSAAVTWWCLLPKRDPALHGDKPFKAVIYGHGYTSTRFEMMAFAGRATRFGMAACGLDAFGHGLVLPDDSIDFGGGVFTYEELLTDLVGEITALGPFAEALLHGRARDLDNDGTKDSGGDFWTADIFHTRDVVRQTIVDHMQFIRVLRSFDGTRTWQYDTNGDGLGDLAGDFDGDGIVDLGGPADNYFMWGQSLGGIIAGVLGGIEPSLIGAAPVAGGAGLMDIGVRSRQGGVPEAVFLPLMGPFIIGNPQDGGLGVAVKFLVNNVNNQSHHPFAVMEAARPGDRIEVYNSNNGELAWAVVPNNRKFRIPIPADALTASERRPVLGLDLEGVEAPVELQDTTRIGDALTIRVFVGTSEELRATVDTFEVPVTFQGTIYPEGAPLVAISKGLGLRRNSPSLRRMMGLSQMILEAGDPVSYAPHYDQPLDFSYDPEAEPGANVLVIPTAGDMNVPVNTGIQIARAAGMIELEAPNPAYNGTPLAGMSDNRVLIATSTVESIECLPRWRSPDGTPVLFDIDDLSEGQTPWQSPTMASEYKLAPLRITMAAAHGGEHGMRLPLLERRGTHGFEPPKPDHAFDIDNYMNNLVYAYFYADGAEIPDHPCLADSSCNAVSDAPSLPFGPSEWEIAPPPESESD